MLPMPPFGLWVPVVVVYAVALLLAVAALVQGEAAPRARLYFFLPVLGLGVFTYHQGRSVLSGLMMASCPAVLLLALFADDLRRRSRRAGAADRVLAGWLLFALAFSVPSLVAAASSWYGLVAAKVRTTRRGQADVVMRDAQFLRRHFRPGDKVVIMSYTSGFYHALTGTTDPLDIPSTSELTYRRDADTLGRYLTTLPGPAVIDRSTHLPAYVAACLQRYPASLQNPDGNLIILRKNR